MENALKYFGTPAYVIGLSYLISFLYLRFKSHQEKKFKVTQEQLSSIIDLMKDKEMFNNRFVLEQVFQFKFNSYLPSSAIYYLLDCNNPTISIKKYISGSRFLEFRFDDSIPRYDENLASESARKKKKRVNYIGYFVFSFLGLGLMMYAPVINAVLGFPWLIAIIPLIFYFLWVAYEFMKTYLGVKAAEDVIEEVSFRNSKTKLETNPSVELVNVSSS